MQIHNIVEGWSNYINDITEPYAIDRAKICGGCEFNKHGKLLIFVKDAIKEIEGNYCDKCKCPLSAKIRSQNEKCDLDLWKTDI